MPIKREVISLNLWLFLVKIFQVYPLRWILSWIKSRLVFNFDGLNQTCLNKYCKTWTLTYCNGWRLQPLIQTFSPQSWPATTCYYSVIGYVAKYESPFCGTHFVKYKHFSLLRCCSSKGCSKHRRPKSWK